MADVKIKLAADTNIGHVRQNNEDNFVVCCDLTTSEWLESQASDFTVLSSYGALLVVADGMGGANAGEVASAIAVESIHHLFVPEKLKNVVDNDNTVLEFMTDTVKSANLNILNKSKEDMSTQGMGTTIVMAWILNDKAYICWCGDSRCYVHSKHGGLIRLSKDHSYVQNLIDGGMLDPEDANDHPLSNVITRCLGDGDNNAIPDTCIYELHDGDTILLCSDGLSSLCLDAQIAEVMNEYRDEPATCMKELIAAALSNGGHDNVTIALCNVCMEDEEEPNTLKVAVKEKEALKRGLVLEGGAMRGLFTCGIIDLMMEHDIWPDGLIGVSAGAAFGCNYKSRQIGRAIRYNKRFAHDSRYSGFKSLLTSGDYFNAKFSYHIVPNQYDIFDHEAFEANPMEFIAVCTDVTTGQAVYKKLDQCNDTTLEWIRASASMPILSKIVEVEGYQLLDGGVADSIPLEHFESIGYHHNLVILTQPEGYQKPHNPLMPLMRLSLRKYPRMIEALDKRHIMYNRQLEYVSQAEQEGRCLVIRPDEKLPIGHISHDPEEMQRVYDIGRKTGEKYLDRIKEFYDIKS